MENEVFKPIKDYEYYEVSNLGNVRNSKTKKCLKQCYDGYGYLLVTLHTKDYKKSFKVHTLVGKTFIDNPLGLKTIDHINGNKTDNRVENLQWLSQMDNVKRFFKEQITEEQKEHYKIVHRKNMYKMHEKQRKPVICLETGEVYQSIKQASEKLNINSVSIVQVCKEQINQTHGLHFKYYIDK